MGKKAGPKERRSLKSIAVTTQFAVQNSSKISAELRQAVKDLGGDDEDLNLIEGLDGDDDTATIPSKEKGKSSDEASRFV